MNNGINPTAGMLEFHSSSGWIPMCYTDTFNNYAADVACRQLGYPFATSSRSVVLSQNMLGIGITRANCSGDNSRSYKGYLFKCASFTHTICRMQLHLTCYGKYLI